VCRLLRWPSASSGWKRRYRSACRCGATTTARTRAGTTGSPRRSTYRHRSSSPARHHDRWRRRKENPAAGRKYADACNLFGTQPDDVARKLDVLRAHCEASAATTDSVEKTVLRGASALADPDAFVADTQRYADLGVAELAVMPDRHPVEFTEQIAERIAPRIAAIG